MPCVINHELPFNAEDFIHRIGRTGRAGSKGDAIALVDDSEKRLLDDIEKLMKRKLEVAPLPDVKSTPGQITDPFFYKPYEPGSAPKSTNLVSSAVQLPEVKKAGITPAKPAVGALLGGFKKK
jgi:superfamily II DNA/RNA helicase